MIILIIILTKSMLLLINDNAHDKYDDNDKIT